MKNAKSISIVIPVYNEENYLKACLVAIAAQTVKPLEVIVVDNNSSDNSVKIAKSHSFVKVIIEKRQSVLHARTTGFNVAKGDIIGRIDADTLLVPGWTKEVLRIFRDSGVSAVTGPMFFYDMPFSPGNVAVDHLFKGTLYKYNKKFTFLAGNNMAIRKSAWMKVRSEVCSDKTMHEDIDIAIHLSKNRLRVIYDSRMQAGMSARRYDDSPKQLRRYTSMMKQAFKTHGMKPLGVHVSEFGYAFGYVLLWPLRRSYNPKTGRRSLRQFMHGHTARKNPMD